MATAASEVKGTGRRAGLDHDDVVDRALALVESQGAAALTMRGLASELDVSTATIYWHVGGREELVIALIRRLSARQAQVEIDGTDPRERVMSVARHLWSSAQAHRNVTSLAHQVGATTLLELPLEIAMARELEAAGVRGDAARDALRAILMCVAGFLVVAFRGDERVPLELRPRALWSDVADDGIDPGTVDALCEPPDLAALFETTVRAVVDAFVPATTEVGE
jgi:AcrR family transcriptional regulator